MNNFSRTRDLSTPYSIVYSTSSGLARKSVMAPTPPPPPLADAERPKYLFNSNTYTFTMWWCILLLLVLSNIVVSQSIIKTLPGFAGKLPFKLETGLVLIYSPCVGSQSIIQSVYFVVFFEPNKKIKMYIVF